MTIRDAKQAIIAAIEPIYDNREAVNIATLLLEELTGFSKMNQFLQKQSLISEEIVNKLTQSITRLSKGEPIQYIIGKAWFMELAFVVNSHTLIPRPETEELVNTLIKYLKANNYKNVQILEIGSGSGCIPIAIAKYYPNAIITSVDISPDALEVAKINAHQNGVIINWKQLNFLDSTEWEKLGLFDIIISNPPYIRKTEAASMHTNVLAFEPHTALFVEDNDPLIFYKAIHDFCKSHLNKNGAIFLEINEGLGKETAELFKHNYQVEIKNDMQGKERMIMAYQF
ncbi:MAG TPA: peptide chain release factor N(5)-glutamine methyltransferase [Sediminibacterium sp.]|uniref:peptide chain release factor N(5)-glutamine methyltransferase n=1 Tax=Sediminibacterium sp. TaxID=1917865 RepID=UPI0008CF6A05|nr:peptide chain release factor N(5)-glutamine methyltransferase [Sediminibacterium sp.]MBT9483663.1 peptide chain release factor N(5)-glutamine methyltransferase [Sediminibacterium sp.]OHC85764.1 MAG: protein-(glutamine-N5) methyltransferase, release factor-specific [Sphingobacteriia bacterium RIFOXYC2_FULL_35_18]OHC87300.1 MAG: protein-(glutamine-N5) methyltransferase, release factor-specific [Sphingobacteriia bacterium RIFOXYD2_FULL_35_12]HLD52588.1 peptide chain release factor N(5)-glutamin